MRNKIFQFIWYYIVRPLVPAGPRTELNPVIRYSRELYVQVRLAALFGCIDGFLAGDSNSAVFSTFMVMQRFSGLVLAIGRSGSTAADWIDFFMTKRGRYVLRAMISNGVTVVWNIGGNYVLKGNLEKAESGLMVLGNMFRHSWFCTIPPIYYALLGIISSAVGFSDVRYYRDGVIKVNTIIRTMAKPRVIDIYSQLAGPDGNPKPGVLMDLVHFRRATVDIIRREIGGVI
jgi:hypothetical protein